MLKQEYVEFKELEYLRNAMAHGVLSQTKKIKSSLDSEGKLKEKIERLFKQLTRRSGGNP